jgi:hypothetical protein
VENLLHFSVVERGIEESYFLSLFYFGFPYSNVRLHLTVLDVVPLGFDGHPRPSMGGKPCIGKARRKVNEGGGGYTPCAARPTRRGGYYALLCLRYAGEKSKGAPPRSGGNLQGGSAPSRALSQHLKESSSQGQLVVSQIGSLLCQRG